ncbi:MAG TPA: sulfur oxidation c-type cytochrome SoxA [Burkholderiaceae bacterium]|nr:sulfur oxidation c-type cytochrome SoxA [Burkholderiaceae bacterium]
MASATLRPIGFLFFGVSVLVPACVTPPASLESRAAVEAQGRIEGGRQIRYREAPFSGVTADFSQWPSYTNGLRLPPPEKVSFPPHLKGDAAQGRRIFLDRNKGPCTGCHLVQGADVWPAGNVGTDLSLAGERYVEADAVLYQLIYDPRVLNPSSLMPPWGATGLLTPQETVDLVAFLRTQKKPLPPEKDRARDPNTRPRPEPYFGDNLDPTSNPAVDLAEGAIKTWNARGAAGKSCFDCHGTIDRMKGVATRYPKHWPRYRRLMSIEDVIAWHGADATGLELRSESAANVNLSMLIRMQSNGLPVDVDVKSREAAAALERGKARFYQRVGQRNHACADCHDPARGGDKFLGGRLLARTDSGLTRHFPTFRTNFGVVWDIRKRMQWCLLPLGMNYLPADAIEYAEIELYLTSFDRGKPMSVPGIRH